MQQYLLALWQPEGDPPPPEILEPVMAALGGIEDEMKTAGVWVFSGGLHGPESTTVLRAQGDDVLTTDGPYAEGKEFLGGFTIVRAADLDAALEWGRRYAAASGLPIEVRPFRF